MKNLILACSLCSALLTSPAFASETGHDHPHGEQPAKLQLDAGKQWQTDAPLRQSFADTLDAIHTDQLTLAGPVQPAVGTVASPAGQEGNRQARQSAPPANANWSYSASSRLLRCAPVFLL